MNLKEFMEKMSQDKEFAAKFEKVGTFEEVAALAEKEGYHFTAEELKNNAGLTDEALEAVSGGMIFSSKIAAETRIFT